MSAYSEESVSAIVPTLNEEPYIRGLMDSLRLQSTSAIEVICVDGGSTDGTPEIAGQLGARVLVQTEESQDDSMNRGANIARGRILFFLSADVRIRTDAIQIIKSEFQSDPTLIALTGRPIPFEATAFCRMEYAAYNVAKRTFDFLPGHFKRFVPSSSFLAVSNEAFRKVGGFCSGNYNSDGLIGRRLVPLGHTKLKYDLTYQISARRYNKLGFIQFNRQFIYVVENFFPAIFKLGIFKRLGHEAMIQHHVTGQRALCRTTNEQLRIPTAPPD